MPSLNPFTPLFGGQPQFFFGRQEELSFAQRALDKSNSPYRVFFITGNRGTGKTTLLEKISQMARDKRWMSIDVHSTHASQAILEVLLEGTSKGVSGGASAGIRGASANVEFTREDAPTESSLARVLMGACQRLVSKNGILITVDEIQKVAQSDAENLCNAVQLSLRKGLPIMLVLAGLPGSKERVAAYPGCTFMQRAFDMQIDCLSIPETLSGFRTMFARVPKLRVGDELLQQIGAFSQGHPYLMQLVGFYLVECAERYFVGGEVVLTEADLSEVKPRALSDYRENVLAPILGALPERELEYLRTMCETQDAGKARTADIAKALGKAPAQVSSYRQRLIDKRLVEAGERGVLYFALPHIDAYFDDEKAKPHVRVEERWNRRG